MAKNKKNPMVHYVLEKNFHRFLSPLEACGADIPDSIITWDKSKVICKNCRRTKVFKGK